MKVRVVSDLHTEFLTSHGREDLARRISKNPTDVLVLAGDILVAKYKDWDPFISQLADSFETVLWVLGNHEFYGSNYEKAPNKIRERISNITNVHLLDDQSYETGHVTFIGSTLWSDFEKGNPLSMLNCQNGLNDCRQIRFGPSYRKMRSIDFFGLHIAHKDFIFKECAASTERGNTNFVITHHGPTWMSVHPKYLHGTDAAFNGAYVSDLSEEILNHNIHTWVHGHSHNSFNYMVGDTRVYANPAGYITENCFDFDPTSVLEI